MDMAAVHCQETSVSFKRRDCGGKSVDVTSPHRVNAESRDVWHVDILENRVYKHTGHFQEGSHVCHVFHLLPKCAQPRCLGHTARIHFPPYLLFSVG